MHSFIFMQELNDIIDKWREDIIADTQRLVAIDSQYSDDGGPGQPFGYRVAMGLETVLSMANAMGFSTRDIDGYVGEIDYGDQHQGKKIGMIAHVDVVPAGDGWMYPPFSGLLVDGKLYGRGSIDDKGPLVAALYAMRAIKESRLPISNHIRYLIGTDEESGFRCIRYYLTKEKQPWGGFSPDGEFPVIYGEKGTYRFKCDCQWEMDNDSTRFSIIDIAGGLRVNVVPEYAYAKLNGSMALHTLARQVIETFNVELDREKRKEKSSINLRSNGEELLIEVNGKGAHSATPWFGISANNLLLRILRRLPLAQNAEKYLYTLADLFAEGHLGEAAGIACRTPDFGPLTISIGILKVGPHYGSAVFDMRYPNLDEHEQLWRKVTALFAEHQLPITLLEDKPGLYVDKNSFLVQSLLQAYQQTAKRTEGPVTIGGGTYCRAMKNFVAFGPLFPGQRELAHERNEFIYIDDLILCAKIYAQALYNLAK